jgi:hypothetical protein
LLDILDRLRHFVDRGAYHENPNPNESVWLTGLLAFPEEETLMLKKSQPIVERSIFGFWFKISPRPHTIALMTRSFCELAQMCWSENNG